MSTSLKQRIYYCGMVNTGRYSAMIRQPLHIGAAANKMIAVVRAIRDAGADGYLVSLPVLGSSSSRSGVSAMVLKQGNCPQLFLPTVANRFVRKIYALLSFGWFCLFVVKRTDRVILYNHAFEYLLGLIVLNLRGKRPILDVEDAARFDEPGWRGFLGALLFRLFWRMTSPAKLIVSEALANALGLTKYCVVYGAVRQASGSGDLPCEQPSFRPAPGEPFRIHFGGSLCTDTGIDLFCAAVDLLLKAVPESDLSVEFVVTGFGAEEKVRQLVERCGNSWVRVVFYPDLSPSQYREQFRRCHAALSLKLPDSDMGMTTFPSKVVEITSQGLLLISTSASDVPVLFNDGNAILLAEASPSALANAVVSVLNDLPGAQEKAQRGHLRALELFESRRVGKRIVDFVFNVA
jgi:glycosyltransferase involved in cell wall biosynthesis